MNIIDCLKNIYIRFPILHNEMLVVGYSILHILGIIQGNPRDIDVVLVNRSWRLMENKYGVTPLGKINIVIPNISISFYNIIRYDFEFKSCYENSIKVDSFNFMNLKDTLKWGTIMDIEENKIKILKEYLME